MQAEQARKVIDELWPDIRVSNQILVGLNILTKYDPELQQDTHNKQIYAGNFESLVEKMADKDIARMAELGWFEDEESWSHNC